MALPDLPPHVSCLFLLDLERCGSIFSIPPEGSLRDDVALYLVAGTQLPQLPLLSLVAISPIVQSRRFHVVQSADANASDSLLPFYAGALHSRASPSVEFVIVSGLAIFDGLVGHLLKLGRKARRTPAVTLQALIDPAKSTPPSKRSPASPAPVVASSRVLPHDPKAALRELTSRLSDNWEGCVPRMQADVLCTLPQLSNPFSYVLEIICELDLKPSEPERHHLRAIPKLLLRCLAKQDPKLATEGDRALAAKVLNLLCLNAFNKQTIGNLASTFSLNPPPVGPRVRSASLLPDQQSA